MSEEEDEEERRRRMLIRGAAESNSLSQVERNVLISVADTLEAGGTLNDELRKTVRLLVGKAASP